MEKTICVPVSLLEETRKKLNEYVSYIDKLDNRHSHGFADGDMDLIDELIQKIDYEIKNAKECTS